MRTVLLNLSAAFAEQAELLRDVAEGGDAAVEAEASVGEKRKRKRAKKDPDAPKRPGSAYSLFVKQNMSAVREEMAAEGEPTPSMTAVFREIGSRWKALPDKDREVYQQRFSKARATYMDDLRDYQERKGIQPTPPKRQRADSSASAAADEDDGSDSGSSTDDDTGGEEGDMESQAALAAAAAEAEARRREAAAEVARLEAEEAAKKSKKKKKKKKHKHRSSVGSVADA